MTWIDDNKDSGPFSFKKDAFWVEDNSDLGSFSFTEQGDKFGYLNNPNWTGEEGVADFLEDVGMSNMVGIENKHTPCGHWHKVRHPNYGPFVAGRFMAAKDQFNTPYIYVYDVTYKAIIRFDTSIFGSPVVEKLVVNSAGWTLDTDDIYGPHTYARSQRGGYCINKNGNSFWYLFRETGTKNLKLVEIDVSKNEMSIVASTTFTDILSSTSVRIYDGCSNNNFTFWCTNEKTGRILKFSNSDHSLVEDHDFEYEASPYSAPDESIHSLDVHGSNLYWSYVRSALHEDPAKNARYYHIKGDIEFNVDVTKTGVGSGAAMPAYQNYVRYLDGSVYYQRVYYTVTGYLRRRKPTDLTQLSYNDGHSECLLSFLNAFDGYLYFLNYDGSVGTDLRLRKLTALTIEHVKTTAIGAYTNPNAYTVGSAVSAMSEQTGVIMVFRYEQENLGADRNMNYGASFDTDFNLLSDTAYTHILRNSYNIKDNEPVVWPLEEEANWKT